MTELQSADAFKKDDPECIEATITLKSLGGEDFQLYFRAPAHTVDTIAHSPLGFTDAGKVLRDSLEEAFKAISEADSPLEPRLKERLEILGTLLFKLLFPNGAGEALSECIKRARQDNKILRLRLDIQVPEVAALPLELCYDRQHGFLCLDPRITFVRSPAPLQSSQPINIPQQLNMLVVIASAEDQQSLEAEQEIAAIEKIFAPFAQLKTVSITYTRTWDELKRAIKSNTHWHILHVIGHAHFDQQAAEFTIGMSDKTGKTLPISAQQLATLLKAQPSLVLVLLNVCDGGKGGIQSIFSSAASKLALQGVPAVIALQSDISNKAAILLTVAFYTVFMEGAPVDLAFTRARGEILLDGRENFEWCTPILYLSSPIHILIDTDNPNTIPTKSALQCLDEATASFLKKQFSQALEACNQAISIDPHCQEALLLREKIREQESLLRQLDELNSRLAATMNRYDLMKRMKLLLKLERYEEALADCKQLITSMGTNATPLEQKTLFQSKGDAHPGLGQTREAQQAYQKADSLDHLGSAE